MALNFCLGMVTPRRLRDLDDITPSIANESLPPPALPLDERARAAPRAGPPPRPPRLRARYMHIGRIISGTDGVIMKICDDWDGSDAGVPINACSLADLGRNGSISTPALKHYVNLNIIIITIAVKPCNVKQWRTFKKLSSFHYFARRQPARCFC